MSAAQNLEGMVLRGSRAKADWRVIKKLKMEPGHSPGYFSVGYLVENAEKHQAFMKAADLGMFTVDGEDFLIGLQRAVNAHSFERKILDHCKGNNLDRVVTALDYGDSEIFVHGARDRVFFLVFELADGDLRKHVEKQQAIDLLWCATALHNFFVAVTQLHGALVAHNDIKPGNALVFDKGLQKISDLGRATTTIIHADHDTLQCAGDARFAPPEQLYPLDLNTNELPLHERRVAGDLYNLGSMAHYMMTARMVTPEVLTTMRPEFRPRNMAGGSRDSYQAALPYWREAFAKLLERLRHSVAAEFAPAVQSEAALFVQIVTQLCEPDPLLRGHPKNRSGSQSRYGLERYISSLAHTKTKLAIKAA